MQDSARGFSSTEKPVRREKRNINASIFDDSDDEASTAMDQMLPRVHRQPDMPKITVSSVSLHEHFASSSIAQRVLCHVALSYL